MGQIEKIGISSDIPKIFEITFKAIIFILNFCSFMFSILWSCFFFSNTYSAIGEASFTLWISTQTYKTKLEGEKATIISIGYTGWMENKQFKSHLEYLSFSLILLSHSRGNFIVTAKLAAVFSKFDFF